MQNCNYNKTRLLADMKSILWRINHYYKKDSSKAKHPVCAKILKDMEKDLAKYADRIQANIAQLSKASKFK